MLPKDQLLKYKEVLSEMRKCESCALKDKECFPATGPITASTMIIGQAPSLKRKCARHFSEKSNKVFSAFLEDLHLDYDKVWVTNAIKCIDRSAQITGSEKQCRRFLKAELALVKPKEIFVFGTTATIALFGKTLPYTSFKRVADGIIYHILPHPMTAVYPGPRRELYHSSVKRVIEYRRQMHVKSRTQQTLM